jgi:phytoene synthase
MNSPDPRDDAANAMAQRRGTPPGSMRYYAVLFAAPSARPVLHALYALEAELRDAAASASHDIAHTRIQWWREELGTLGEGRPRHPITITLAPVLAQRPGDVALLGELALGAALDLARHTYGDWSELEAYCSHSAGVLQEVIAGVLAAVSGADDAERRFARRLGSTVRQTEMLRDFAHDLRRGLLYLPTSALVERRIDPRGVQSHPDDPALTPLLVAWQSRLAAELDALPDELDARQRRRQGHGLVLAALHRRLLSRIGSPGAATVERVDLPPIARLWTAWRTAVASQRS